MADMEKTFTQEEVDKIVQERLQREKNKQPELEKREKDLPGTGRIKSR